MNRKILNAFLAALFLILFFSAGVYAQCNSTQVDINSANASELDRIYGIGPTKVQNIIYYREIQQFNSLEDMINISGIGSTTLNKIERQGIACVNLAKQVSSKSAEIQSANESPQINNSAEINSANANINSPQEINLNSQNETPKNQVNSSSTSTSIFNSDKMPIYGLIAFSAFLCILFAAKKIRIKRYKSEFN